MAIYHLHAKTIKRSNGQTSVASAAYRSGEVLEDYKLGRSFDFSRKQGIIHTEIVLPKNTPEDFSSREILWNEVEQKEKRKDAQLAREIVVALPRELTEKQNIDLVQKFTQENFVNVGMIADIAIHQSNSIDGEKNPHAHIMLTMREVDSEGFNKKNRDWNKKETLQSWRINWQKSANDFLSDSGSTQQIDHRTLIEQEINREPTFHIGYEVNEMEKKGIITDVKQRFNEVISNNKYFQNVREAAQRASDWALNTQEEIYTRFQQYTKYLQYREQQNIALDSPENDRNR